MLTATRSNGVTRNATGSLVRPWPGLAVTERSPPNVTGTEVPEITLAIRPARPIGAARAIATRVNVTDLVPNRFERCTRTSRPPQCGEIIPRNV